jgi:hypothetical protein
MGLLSANDFNALKEAMRYGEEIKLTRTLRDITITAGTYRVKKPPWDVDMIIQVRFEQGNITYIQNFKTVEAAKQQVYSWQTRLY